MKLKLLLLTTTFISTATVIAPAMAANDSFNDSPMIVAQAQEQQRPNTAQDERRQQRQEQRQERAQEKQDKQDSRQQAQTQKQDERREQQPEKAQQKQEQKQERAQQQEKAQPHQEQKQGQEQKRDERPTAQTQTQPNQKNEPHPTAQERREQKQDERQNAREQKQDEKRDQKQDAHDQKQDNRRDQKQDARDQRQDEKRDQKQDARDQRQDEKRDQKQDARDQRQDEKRDQKQDARDQKQDNRRDARDDRRDDKRDEAVLRGRGERLDDLRKERREEKEGDRVVIREPGGRTIIRDNGRAFIRHDETERFRVLGGGNARFEQRGNERITIINRPGGIQIYTSVDNDGRLLRRWRRGPDGREVIIIDNRPRRPGASVVIQLAPPVIRIPRERYIVEMRNAQPPAVYAALIAPPVERIERAYTLDEVRASPQVLARMPRVDLDTLTFASGSWEVDPSQADRLSVIADGLKRAVEANPNEVFLIEGHTDAVGDEVDNLSLSDRRAESVAILLSEQFGIPPENLTTQGYGEADLKVQTDGPEEANRRVTVRRITPLLTGQAEASGQGAKQ